MIKSVLTEHPLIVYVILFISGLIIFNTISSKIIRQYGIKVLFFLSSLAILNYLSYMIIYIIYESYFDHVEPAVASISWLFEKGKPVYPGLDSAERYSMVYGPVLYIINGTFLKLLGPSIITSKLGGILSATVSLILLFLSFSNTKGHEKGLIWTGFIAMTFLIFGHCTFWNRSDSFIILGVSLSLYGIIIGNRTAAIILTALATGACINMKIHAILYFIPLFVLFFLKFNIKYTFYTLLLSFIIIFLPFILFHNISLYNYTAELSKAAKTSFNKKVFIMNIEFISLFLIPLLMSIYNKEIYERLKEHKFYFLSLLGGILPVIIIASSTGAGRYHFLPFIPLLIYLWILIYPPGTDSKPVIKVFATSLIVIFIMYIFTPYSWINYMGDNKFKYDITNDIKNIMTSSCGDTICMGYGDNNNYRVTFLRPLLIFSGNPCLIESPALFGCPVSRKTLEVLKNGYIKIWLVPKGSNPFEMVDWFTRDPLFSNEFKRIFHENYELKKESQFFNIWIYQ